MENPFTAFSEFVGMMMSWILRRSEPSNVSRDFWMPDSVCVACYECDSPFTLFNRRHHCRLCGRIFCGKCTTNFIPSLPHDASSNAQEVKLVRVCNFCYKQWEQERLDSRNGVKSSSDVFDSTLSNLSLGSTNSNALNSCSMTPCSLSYKNMPHQCAQYDSTISLGMFSKLDLVHEDHDNHASQRETGTNLGIGDHSSNQFNFQVNRYAYEHGRSNEEEDYDMSRSDSESQHITHSDIYYGPAEYDEAYRGYGSSNIHSFQENDDLKDIDSPLYDQAESHHSVDDYRMNDEAGQEIIMDDRTSSIYSIEAGDNEPVDFDNNEILWFPPDPEDEEDERDGTLFDDEDDEDATGEWGYDRSVHSSCSGEYRSRDKTNEEHKKVMKNVVDGHFRALISQLLQVENVPIGEEGDQGSWLEIITSLSWEAATLLKPDTSKGGGMDPGGYVKIKCIACGHPTESMVVKGIVCRKNVSHRRMAIKIEKPHLLILGGALEYQRVANSLSSFDTLLQQEMDHLKMAVAKIEAHHPHVLLVEKSVSRFAQEYLLAKNVSLVLNIKRPLLERIARCTGAQIVPSTDHLSSQNLGCCDLFKVEKCLEEHGSAGQGGKKMVKTLMYFEGCPKPLGCTILLKGATGDVLKKLKHVIQYGIFAAYHLALETSFLADEGASLPELPLKSPIKVALPDKPSSFDPSISKVRGFHKDPSISKPQLTIDLPSRKGFEGTGSNLVSPAGIKKSPIGKKDHIMNLPGEYSSNDAMKVKNKVCFGEVHDAGTATNELVIKSDADDFRYTGDSKQSKKEPENEQKTEYALPKEEFPTDHQSILVSLSTRSVWKGAVCERSHLFRIRYYSSFDKPLGRFLRDNLFDQNYKCRSCDTPPEAHVHCYTHHQGSLTISVRRHEHLCLPGERDGKIWMWHRCLKCPRVHGHPPPTRRIVMSDAAWGLSFGKFLELSFSNHAAASRVASCGHSLHRDCLRFYGFGETVACFRYASIDVNSVYLPPHKLSFVCENQEWIQRESNEVDYKTELLFNEVSKVLQQIAEGRLNSAYINDVNKISELRNHIHELEAVLQKEKAEFEDSLKKLLPDKEAHKAHSVIDILEVNKLRRQLLFQSYLWDQRLIFAAGSSSILAHDMHNVLLAREREKSSAMEKLSELNIFASETQSTDLRLEEQPKIEMDPESFPSKRCSTPLSTCISAIDQLDPLEHGLVARRTLSDGQFPIPANLSATFDAKWTGEDNCHVLADAGVSDSASVEAATTMSISEESEERSGADITYSFASALLSRLGDSAEDISAWIRMPFLHIYRSINKNLGLGPRFCTLNDYNPVYMSLFRELECQGRARLLLPIGVNDVVIPVYDDEPTSIVSYALVSHSYHSQMLDNVDGSNEPGASFLSQSADDMGFKPFKSFGSNEGSILSLSDSRMDSLTSTKVHIRVSFCDEGPLGKVRYTVTCYYAKKFDALRRICCPSELDFVRSLSRCKKWGAQGGKSNVFFAKSLDDRFIVKQVTKTELDSFIKFGAEYFKYLSESIGTGSPTCLAKILGIYQITSKHLKGSGETKMDVLVMENLLFEQNVTRLYDLKGSLRSRYNTDCNNNVLLDQNLLEATSPIFVGNKAKRLLERAVWNDTSFLAFVDVMDYSLLVGVDEVNHKLVVGIIDFMRQYTWDKHLETWVKASGILGGPKNVAPTVISPKQYKKRFRKAMAGYFLVVPDQWSPPANIPTSLQQDSTEANQNVASID